MILTKGQIVKVIDANGIAWLGTVQQVAGNIVWIMDGDLYWLDCGIRIGSSNVPDDRAPRIEHATADDLLNLTDVGLLA